MKHVRRLVLTLLASAFCAPGARADSDQPTTISSEDHALSRSESAVSLSPAMPSGPPALSSAGAPDAAPTAPPAALPAPAPVPEAVPTAAPAAAPPAVKSGGRAGDGKLTAGRGERKTAVPGGGVIVDRDGRRLEIAPRRAKASRPVLPPAAPPSAPVPPAVEETAPHNDARNRGLWLSALAIGGVAAALGLLTQIK